MPNVSSFLFLKGQQPAGGGGKGGRQGRDCWQRMEVTPYHFNVLRAVLPITFCKVPCKTQVSPISHSTYPLEIIHQESDVNTRAFFFCAHITKLQHLVVFKSCRVGVNSRRG